MTELTQWFLTRGLLWLVVPAPVLFLAASLLHARWRGLRPKERVRQALLALAVFLALAGCLLGWDLWRSSGAEATTFHLQQPYYLLLLPPCYATLLLLQWRSLAGLAPARMWLAFLARCGVLILLVLALCGLQMILERDLLTVLFAVDRSRSVSAQEVQRALAFANAASAGKPAGDRAGLIVFGSKAATEVWPREIFQAPQAADLKAEIQPEGTNIGAACARALATFDETTGRRLILFTDGRQTEGDAAEEVKRLRASGVDVWIAPLRRAHTAEILIDKVEVPRTMRTDRPLDARVFVFSNTTTKARVTFYPGDKKGPAAYEQFVELQAGQRTPVVFPGIRYRTPGYKQLEAVVEPLHAGDDTLPENNHAFTFTDVEAESRVLILTSDLEEVKHLVGALETEKLALDVRSGAQLPENAEEYRRYDCIALVNLGRPFLGEQQMAVIESCVRDQGAGLVMIGGDQSFGAGGYLNTPIENALPVTMDLRNQRVMPSGALGIVLHTCEFADGNAWGKKIAKAAINVLSPQDYAGLLYYGGFGGETWLFQPSSVSRKAWMFSLIDGCQPGDMPDLDKIVSMAVNRISALQNVSLKHVIVITDGDPSPPSPTTIAAAKNGKITVTVVTIYPHQGGDVAAMKDVAAQTGGRYYNPSDPRKLPLIFVKEAAIVRKSLIHMDEKGIPLQLGAQAEILREFGQEFPPVRAFVVTNTKDRAEQHLYTVIEGEKVPLLARWQYGLGKAVAFTSDTTNRWAPAWVKWGSYEKFWTNIFYWAARQRMPSNHRIDTEIKDGQGRVMVEALDSNGQYLNFANLVGVANEPLQDAEGEARSHSLRFTMTQPGRYEAVFPAPRQGVYTVTITDMSNPNKPSSIVTGLENSYSAEFRNLGPDEPFLNRLGEIAGGAPKTSHLASLEQWEKDPLLSGIFQHNLPPTQSPTDLFWPLLLAALCLFPLDVAVRRLHFDPLTPLRWLAAKAAPLLAFGRRARTSAGPSARPEPQAPPPPLVPTGADSRAAQSRYESAGETAGDLDLKPDAHPGGQPKAVGGKGVSKTDEAASEYTRALLKAKRRARKE